MVSNVSNNQNYIYTDKSKYEKPSPEKVVGGFVAGCATYSLVPKLIQPLNKYISNKWASTYYNNDEFYQVAKKVFKDSGLPEKGVEFIDVRELDKTTINNIKTKIIPNYIKRLPQPIRKIYERSIRAVVDQVVKGDNALWVKQTKQVLIHPKKIALASFHEMGHALAHFSPLGFISKMRTLSSFAIPVLFYTALLKRKKVEGEKPKGKLDKTTTFIKNNVGKLMFLSYLPLLMDETIASVKGYNLAKKHLTPDLLKKLNRNYAKAFLTYLMLPLTSVAAIKVASFVRDKIAQPKEVNNN